MSKQKLEARIRYTVLFEREGYIVEIRTAKNEEWGMDSFYPCFEKKGGSGKDFVHFSVLKKLCELQFYGYEIDIRC